MRIRACLRAPCSLALFCLHCCHSRRRKEIQCRSPPPPTWLPSPRKSAGDKISVESIAKGYQDPHFVEAKPSFLLKLRQADLLIVVGLQLEIGWLPPLITQSGNPRIQVGAARISGRFAVRRDSRNSAPAR